MLTIIFNAMGAKIQRIEIEIESILSISQSGIINIGVMFTCFAAQFPFEPLRPLLGDDVDNTGHGL